MATAEDDGKPLIFRIREHAPSFAKKSAFRQLLAISWQYQPSNDQGMPAQVDVDRMAELEDLLMPTFKGTKVAFLTAIDFVSAPRDRVIDANDLLEDLLRGRFSGVPIQIRA